MAILSRWLQLVTWACALSCSTVATAASDDLPDFDDLSTGITELHQVFPRNETYAPSPLFPVMFAFQNPTIAYSLTPSLSVTLLKWNQSISDWDVNDTTNFHLGEMANASDSEPFFVHHVFGGNFDTEAYWSLGWSLTWINCTEGEGRYIYPYSGNFHHYVRFTTEEGGREPDLVASSDDSQCSDFPSVTLNITEIGKPYPQSYPGQWCAYFSSVKPDPKPCEVQVSSELQESILASATNVFCRGLEDVDCPSDEDDEEDHGETIRGSLAATVAACFVSVAVGISLLIV